MDTVTPPDPRSTRARSTAGPLLALLLLAGCSLPTEPLPIGELDAVFYRDHVAPVVGPTCASLECHGVEGRALRLYAEDGLRREDEYRGQPLTMDEARWNAAAFVGVDPEPVTDDAHIALTKPLSRAAGGVEHVADDVWLTTDSLGYQCLRGWLAGQAPVEACTAAAPTD